MNRHFILQAIDANENSVYIDDVPNGKKCECHCRECGGVLIARQGRKRIHHFAHFNGSERLNCSMTALHLLAEEIILEEKRIPSIVNSNIEFVDVKTVQKEKNLGDIVPDLYAEYEGYPVAVEIFVSNPVGEVKLEKIRNRKLTAFEINLSKLDFKTKNDVRNAIYDINNVKNLYNPFNIMNKINLVDTIGNVTGTIKSEELLNCQLYNELRNKYQNQYDVDFIFCEQCSFCQKFVSEIFCELYKRFIY